MVYYIRNAQGHIKIGCSFDVYRRFKQHLARYGMDIDLLGYERGNETLERKLHVEFAQFRVNEWPRNRSEWFLPNDVLLARIASLK